MSQELDDLAVQVKANTDAEASAIIVINGIAAQIAAALANASLSPADKAKLTQLTNDLKASATALAGAIVANTTAQPSNQEIARKSSLGMI